MSGNVTESSNNDPALWTAIMVLRVVATTALLLYVVVFSVEFEGLREEKRFLETAMAKDVRRMRFTLLGNTVANLLTFGLVVANAFLVPASNQTVCEVLAKLEPIGYFVATISAWSFFVVRALLVGQFENARWYRALSRTMLVLVPASVFVIAPTAAWSYRGVISSPLGMCLQFGPYVELEFSFIGINAFLSLGLLALFLRPMLGGVANAPNKQYADRIRRVAQFHVTLTLVSVFVTTACVVAVAVGNDTYVMDNTQEFSLVYAVAAYVFDMAVNGIIIKCMTLRWMPKRLRSKTSQCFVCVQDSLLSPDGSSSSLHRTMSKRWRLSRVRSRGGSVDMFGSSSVFITPEGTTQSPTTSVAGGGTSDTPSGRAPAALLTTTTATKTTTMNGAGDVNRV